jgi:hypothetical protein
VHNAAGKKITFEEHNSSSWLGVHVHMELGHDTHVPHPTIKQDLGMAAHREFAARKIVISQTSRFLRTLNVRLLTRGQHDAPFSVGRFVD